MKRKIEEDLRKASMVSSVSTNSDFSIYAGDGKIRKRRDTLVSSLPIPLLYNVAEFFGPLEMSAMCGVNSFWRELCKSEMLWMMLAYRLDIFGYGDWPAIKHQMKAFLEKKVDGRAWRMACMIGLAFKEFWQGLPDNVNCYGVFDFEHAPSKNFSARKKVGKELFEPDPVTKFKERPVALLVWDPEGFPNPRRRPQLEHFRKINSLHENIPWITHVFHFRRKGDIRLQTILQKLAYGYGKSEDLMREESTWGLPPMFQKKMQHQEEDLAESLDESDSDDELLVDTQIIPRRSIPRKSVIEILRRK